MERYFDLELDNIKKKLLLIGGSVESQLQNVFSKRYRAQCGSGDPSRRK